MLKELEDCEHNPTFQTRKTGNSLKFVLWSKVYLVNIGKMLDFLRSSVLATFENWKKVYSCFWLFAFLQLLFDNAFALFRVFETTYLEVLMVSFGQNSRKGKRL